MLLDLFSLEYGAQVVVPGDTHDGADPIRRYQDDDAALQRRAAALQKREAEKLAQRERLREQIERAAYGEPETGENRRKPAETTPETVKDNSPPQLSAQPTLDLRTLDLELSGIADQLKALAIEARRRRQEDEIHAILLTLH